MPWQILNLSFWAWLAMTPAEQTRRYFAVWNDTHKKSR